MTEINIILNILEQLVKATPTNSFIQSLHQQYCNIGGLSKKQLEGLHTFATKSGKISTAKLATLEAIIKKKPNRYKSDIVKKAPEENQNAAIEKKLDQIIEKYPQHKMALFILAKIKHKDPISPTEIAEINRLAKLLLS